MYVWETKKRAVRQQPSWESTHELLKWDVSSHEFVFEHQERRVSLCTIRTRRSGEWMSPSRRNIEVLTEPKSVFSKRARSDTTKKCLVRYPLSFEMRVNVCPIIIRKVGACTHYAHILDIKSQQNLLRLTSYLHICATHSLGDNFS